MADDRTIDPRPSRWRRAWQAGVRPRTRWLLPAVVCAALAFVLDGEPMDPRDWGFDIRPGTLSPKRWLERITWSLGAVWGLIGLLVLVVSLLTRQLGGISASARDRLRAARSRPAVFPLVGLTLLVGVGSILALAGVLAGAARSVDATAAGLVFVWRSWATRAAAVLAVGLSLAALGELVLDRSDRRARLRQSREQLREDLRDAGGR